MPTWYCHSNEPKDGWPPGNPGIRGFMDLPSAPRLPNALPNRRGNFSSRNWFTADAYADEVGMTTADAQTYLDAAVACGTVTTGVW